MPVKTGSAGPRVAEAGGYAGFDGSFQNWSPTAWYNLACSLALTGQADDAFAALEKAIALGYDDAEWMREDEDFAPIRQDPRFARLLALLQARSP